MRPRQRQRGMAFPKPVRLLAAACMALFFFLMLRMIWSPRSISLPGSGDKEPYTSFVRDPNLDGMIANLPTRTTS